MSNNSDVVPNSDLATTLAAMHAQKGSGTPMVAIFGEETGAQDVREVSGTLKSIGDSSVTAVAGHILSADHEPMVWQESPSLVLMVWPTLKFLFLTAVALFALVVVQTSIEKNAGPQLTNAEYEKLAAPLPLESVVEKSKKRSKAEIEAVKQTKAARTALAQEQALLSKRAEGWKNFRYYEWARNAFLAYLFYKLAQRFAQLKTTRYRMSSQRLILDRGILSRTSVPVELHNLGQAVIHQPLLLRLFKVSNVYVSGILLEGLRNAELVRDLIRGAGQLEAQRTDKIRWR